MNTIRNLLSLAVALSTAQFSPAADVPSGINYQGRLTNAAGVPQPGTRAMSIKIYDASTDGAILYAENIGNVVVDANGVYSFQFGADGISNTPGYETIGTTNGSSTTFQKTLSNTPVIVGSASVTDGTYNWNEITGNPGSRATATATVTSGFVVGANITSGGSGYTSTPAVTITGNGSGATASATVSGGSVTAINIINAGSGYTTGATITVASPPGPFVVNYSGGTITVTYATVPIAGKTITATYKYTTSGISGALAASSEQWLELSIDGVIQTPRQKVLAVPFALVSAKTLESPKLKARIAVGAAGTATSNGFLLVGVFDATGGYSGPSSIRRLSGSYEAYERRATGTTFLAPLTIPLEKGDQWSSMWGEVFFIGTN